MINARNFTGAAGVAPWLAGFMLAMQLAALLTPSSAFASQCRPRRPLPSVILQSMGPCNFNVETLSFAGDSIQQAACLVRPVNRWAHLGPPLGNLPGAIAHRVGGSEALPDRAALTALINESGLAPQFAEGLNSELSHARDGDPFSPMARYFVIHDTSGPKLGAFPTNLDENAREGSFSVTISACRGARRSSSGRCSSATPSRACFFISS